MRSPIAGVVLSVLFLAAPVSAQNQLPGFERVLLPITVRSAPGAFGSSWTTDSWIYIDSDRYLVMPLGPSWDCDPDPSCIDAGWGPTHQHQYPLAFYRTRANERPGSYLYVDRRLGDSVFVQLLLRNEADALAPAVALPIARERDFRDDRLQLLALPPSTTHRALLRVYGYDPELTGDVRVRVIDGEDQSVLHDSIEHLDVVQREHCRSAVDPCVPIRPPAVEVPVVKRGRGFARVEVTPVTAGLRIWGFVSLTDNITQHVTLRVPH